MKKTQYHLLLIAIIALPNLFHLATAQIISSGTYHTLIVCNNGNVNGWGVGWSGQLGDGNNSSALLPVQSQFLSNITAVVASDESSLALRNDGTVWAFGSNQYGELGNGGTAHSKIPLIVNGLTGITAIAGGNGHFLALKNDGTVWAWGRNVSGELGIGTTVNSKVPVQISGLTNVVALAKGNTGDHSMAIKSDGTVWAWGGNYSGQLGNVNSNGPSEKVPVAVAALTNVASIARGEDFTLVLKTDGTVWSFGGNEYGELGRGTSGTSTYSGVPTQITSLSGITNIDGGDGHAIALKSDGTVWTWGQNYYGELGNGNTTDSSVPVMVPGLSGIVNISMGKDHAHAIKNDGSVWSWGRGSKLGNGSNDGITSKVPVQTTGLCATITGIENLISGLLVSLYPNPNNGQFVVDLDGGSDTEMRIYNALGQVVYTCDLVTPKIQFSLSLEKGIYYYNIISKDRSFGSGKLLIQ